MYIFIFSESFMLFEDRLKSAYNPINVLAPLSAQISEAIMYFQEKGHHFSNRMILQCFSPLKNGRRFKRQNEIGQDSSESLGFELKVDSFESDESNEISFHKKKLDPVKESINLFIDRVSISVKDDVLSLIFQLIRMKNFWRSLPDAICTEKRIVASPGESCWNGYSMGKYTRRVVGDGIASQRKNPEFLGYKGVKESHIDERVQFAYLANELTSLYYGKKSDYVLEGSGNASSDFIEGSGLPPIDDEDLFNEINFGNFIDDEELEESIINNALPSSTAFRIPCPFLILSFFPLFRIF